MAEIEMSKAVLVNIVAALSSPLTDVVLPFPQWDPILQRWVLVVPVPPNQPEPQPNWSTMVTRTVIDRALAQQRLALALGDGTASDAASAAIRDEIVQFVDELCTRSPDADLPSFSSLAELAVPAPVDLLRAGAQFQSAAAVLDGPPLRAELTAAADRLFGTALARIAAHHEATPATMIDAKHEAASVILTDAKHEAALAPSTSATLAGHGTAIAGLTAKHEQLAGVVAKHESILAKHEAILDGLTGGTTLATDAKHE